MNSALLAIVLALWLICGVLTFGGLFAHLQNKYPSQADDDYRGDLSYAISPLTLRPLRPYNHSAFYRVLSVRI
jgi:hypothetical protein